MIHLKNPITRNLIFCIICVCSYHPLLASNNNDQNLQSLDTMQVIQKKEVIHTIDISEIETDIGYQADASTIVYMNPGIQRVPETGSQLLVNGGSIYDNIVYINSVPMFVPAHFSGHFMFDINSILIPAIKNIQLISHSLPGNYAGASNSAILVEPGIYTSKNEQWRRRPQLLVTLGNFDAGLCLSQEFRKGEDCYQITANVPNSHLIKFKYFDNQSFIWSDISYYQSNTNPLWYEDITFTGENRGKRVVLKEHFWLALDGYSSGSTIPWGMGNITVTNKKDERPWSITLGGSRQYSRQLKILGPILHENKLERSIGSLFSEIQELPLGLFMLDVSLRGEYLQWKGRAKTYQKKGHPYQYSRSQNEIQATAHAGLSRKRDRFSYGIDILGGGMVYDDYSLFCDPGLWSTLQFPKGSISFQGGIQTSWPDIRGFPDKNQRTHQIKTNSGALIFTYDNSKNLDLLIQNYVRWKEHAPIWSENPYAFRWNPSMGSSLLSYGISGKLGYTITKMISTHLLVDINGSELRGSNTANPQYNWDMPWSFRPLLQGTFMAEKLNIYLSGIFSEGLPYRELILVNDSLSFSHKVKRMPWYRRVDLKLQYDQPLERHRYFTEFTVFIDLHNIFDILDRFKPGPTGGHYWENVREYYWNEYMIKKPISLERSSITLGMRASFRL